MELTKILSFLDSSLNDEELIQYKQTLDILKDIKIATFNTFKGNFNTKNKFQHQKSHNTRKKNIGFQRNINNPSGFIRNNRNNTGGGFARAVHKNKWKTENRYLSMYSKKAKDENEKLLNNISDKLNKITEQNYNEFLEIIRSDLQKVDENTLKKFVNEVFNKAARQSMFCNLYVRILASCIDISDKIEQFISLIIQEYLQMFNTKVKKISADNYDEFCQNNKEKEYRIGYSAFIGELYKCSLINTHVLCSFATSIFDTVKKETSLEYTPNIKENIQDNIDCFKNLMTRLMKKEEDEIDTFKQGIKDSIQEYLSIGRPTLRKKIGMKSVFSLEDITKLA